MASPLNRHRSSLEDVLDFSPQEHVFANNGARQHAETLLSGLLQQLEASQNKALSTPYLRIEMVRLMHRFSQTQQSKDLMLRSFFSSVNVDMAADLDMVDLASLPAKVVEFTDYVFDNFFLPLKASSAKTPQPTPASLSVPSIPADQILPGSRHRISTLRRDCLIRDRHRCVVTRKFDRYEARIRHNNHGASAADDDGVLFDRTRHHESEYVEVAHILPHSLMTLEGDAEIVTARRNAVAILDMFDVGVRHLIDGLGIDRPTNAVTLTQGCHSEFGTFHMYFEAVHDAPPHTYAIQSFLPPYISAVPETVTRTLFTSENHTIDPPLPRLLAIHAAVAKVMHMSGAGAHCEKVLRDTEELLIKADGSTNLGTLAALRLGGWWNGVVV